MSADGLRELVAGVGGDLELASEGRMGLIRVPLSKLDAFADLADRGRVVEAGRQAGLTHIAVEILDDDDDDDGQ